VTEWGVFGVIVALIGFAAAIIKPIVTLNTSITTLKNAIDALGKELEKQNEENRDSHDRLWRHDDKQDEQIADHEKRITVLERTE
jgi:hypothetical protein